MAVNNIKAKHSQCFVIMSVSANMVLLVDSVSAHSVKNTLIFFSMRSNPLCTLNDTATAEMEEIYVEQSHSLSWILFSDQTDC